MNKKALNEKYSYQIDEYNVVHLFRGEDEYQQYLINPLLSAIFKIETIEKENAEVKKELVEKGQLLDLTEREWGKDTTKLIHFKTQLTKAKEIIKKLYSHVFQGMDFMELNDFNVLKAEAEQFLSEVEE